jgi:RNA polymerase sigma factor (sigma-70 family)
MYHSSPFSQYCDGFPLKSISLAVTSSFAIDVPDLLLKRACAGDADAFEQIYRWFERPVYTLALRMLGNPSEAQDVLQDSMLKLIDHITHFRGQAPFWSWLRQIAVNESLMRLRKRQHDGVDDAEEMIENAECDGLLPPQAADQQRLWKVLQNIPAITRSVLWLYHAEGYTHEEIAQLMNKTPSFSKSQVARGLKRLRVELGVEVAHA